MEKIVIGIERGWLLKCYGHDGAVTRLLVV
jgi:hypothetical protein